MRTYYVGGGGQASVEYTQAVSGGVLHWSKSYIYAGGSVLATIAPYGQSEYVEYHHPDRLGTRLISNNQNVNVQEQETLPFGAALSSGSSTRQFTSYDRSNATGLDYAVNRRYDSLQGRFTQVDPIGAGASSLTDPQSWNMYAYVGNDPVNHVDPDGLFFKKLFKWIGKALKILTLITIAVVAAIVFAPASSFIFKAAMWLMFKVLIPLSKIPFIGKAVSAGMAGSMFGGTPGWNPSSRRSGIGDGWQDGEEVYESDIEVNIITRACANGNKFPHCGAGWGGLVPVVGPAWNARDAFRSGRWGWGIFHTAEAVSDVFLVKAAATGIAKGAFKTGSHTWSATRQWINRTGRSQYKGQHFHHWLLERNQGIGKYAPDWLKNQPYNLMGLPGTNAATSNAYHIWLHHGANPAQRLWYGTPRWFKYATTSAGGRVIGTAQR